MINSKKTKCGITGYSGNLGKHILKSKKFIFVKFTGDITKPKMVNKWIKNNKFDLIIHLAAVVPTKKVLENFAYAKKVNVDGTKNLVNAINKYSKNLIWFFYSSTSHVYSFSKKKISENYIKKPISKYGETKLKGEKIIEKYLDKKINYTIGRIFSFTSKLQDQSFFIPSIKRKVFSNKKNNLYFSNVNHYRDFIKIEYIVDIIFFLFKKRYRGVINIASGIKISLKDIIIKLNNKKNRLFFQNEKFEKSQFASIKKLRSCGYKRKNLNWYE